MLLLTDLMMLLVLLLLVSNLLEVLEATLLRSSCCRLGPWLLLSHSDNLKKKNR